MERLEEISAQLKLFEGRRVLPIDDFALVSSLAIEALGIRLSKAEIWLADLEKRIMVLEGK